MRNVGKWDQVIRYIIGFVLIGLVFVGPRTEWGWLGLIPIATALMGWCPLYRVLGISSRRKTPSSLGGAKAA